MSFNAIRENKILAKIFGLQYQPTMILCSYISVIMEVITAIVLLFSTYASGSAFHVQNVSSELVSIDNGGCVPGPLEETLEIMCKNGYAYRCNDLGLTEVPTTFPAQNATNRLCLLDLSGNHLTHINNNSFTKTPDIMWLYLSRNGIRRIDSGAFTNLTSLVFLNLTSNLLNIDSFKKDVFKPLGRLRAINLKNNTINSYKGLHAVLQPLNDLQSLFISGCTNCTFEDGFESLKSLRNLSLSGTGPNLCNIRHLQSNTFSHLPQLINLYVSSCNVTNVDAMAFRPLKNLEYLDISYNEMLHFEGMKKVLEGLAGSPIKALNLNHIYELFERGNALKLKHIEPIKDLTNLTKLYFDLNKIEVIEKEVFSVLPKSLKKITMSGNRLTYGSYVKYNADMTHLLTLDLSRQHLSFDPYVYKHYPYSSPRSVSDNDMVAWSNGRHSIGVVRGNIPPNNTCSSCLDVCRKYNLQCFCLPPKLQKLKWKMSSLRFPVGYAKVCKPSNLTILDLGFNLILEWIGPVDGLEQLVELNLAENYCKNMSSYFFDTFFSLQKLNISFNFLGPILNPANQNSANNSTNFFKNLTKLINMDISENRITSLAVDTFQNLKKIQYLNVSRNMMTYWNSSLQSSDLKYLDLSGNRFENLPDSLRDYLENLRKDGKQIKVNLGDNRIQASCDNRPFLRWLAKTDVSVLFNDDDGFTTKDGKWMNWNDKGSISDLVKRLDKECFPASELIISVCVSTICIITAICSLLSYKYRWKLRHWYYSRRKRHSHKGYNRLFEQDAFISYATSEGLFVKDKLVPALEGGLHGLKLWVADRDSQVGASVAENLTHAINNSKKSVLILSQNYFRENWCNYEMNMARVESIESNRKLLVIVRYEDLAAKDIPLDYLRLMKSEESIEFPHHPQDIATFWNALAEAIGKE